eukprot:5437611-Amphidinium_carterae.2
MGWHSEYLLLCSFRVLEIMIRNVLASSPSPLRAGTAYVEAWLQPRKANEVLLQCCCMGEVGSAGGKNPNSLPTKAWFGCFTIANRNQSIPCSWTANLGCLSFVSFTDSGRLMAVLTKAELRVNAFAGASKETSS